MPVDRDRLLAHVTRIASTPRPAGSPALAAAREYVAACLRESGWLVSEAPFKATAETGENLAGINLIARHRDHPWTGGPRFCLGAHLDSRAESPGADDNGSAVAALLEIARLLPGRWPASSRLDLELVAFDLEEYGMLGGAERARQCRTESIDLRGMASLEMLGYCVQTPKSQALPRSLVGKYPDVGNWIAVIGNQISAPLIAAFRDGLKTVPSLPVETLQVPENGTLLQATRLSDHSPYWDAGYPALMITDTAFLRNPHYHMPTDTVETLNFEFLTQVTEGCVEAVRRVLEQGLARTEAPS
jgi:Zn-dependent M28 family amino/carboxypeptidase